MAPTNNETPSPDTPVAQEAVNELVDIIDDPLVVITTTADTVTQELTWIPNPDYAALDVAATAANSIKLTAEVLLGRSLLDLLKMAPNNPAVRTMLAKQCRQTLPEELKTVEEIIAWIEANVTAPEPPVKSPANPGRWQDPLPIATRQPGREEVVLNMSLYRNGTESGTCSYSCNTSETYIAHITRDEFRALVEEADSFEDLMRKLEEKADEEFSDNGGDSNNEDYDYEDHECQNSETEESGISNKTACETVAGQLLVQMADRIEDPDDAEDFREKFNL